ncbi:MAG: S9 family peptidase [Planctomycetes bacterium]|nr:S9 family peptidase [Planctomycetota bacterium]
MTSAPGIWGRFFAICLLLSLAGGLAAKETSGPARSADRPAGGDQPVELIPRTVLFGNPTRTSPQISPDGKRLAYLAPVNDVLNVWVKTVGKEDDRAVTKDTDRGIRLYFWAQDNRHLLYLQDRGGDENWRLYAVNLDSGAIRDLTPYDEVQVQVVAVDKHFPNEILIGMNREDPRVHDVYHIDLPTGVLSLRAKNPGNIVGWVADARLKVRAAMVATPEGGFNLLVRPTEDAEWETLVTWTADDSLTSHPVSFNKEGDALYLVDSRNANAGRLVKMELATRKIDVIAQDPQYDVSSVMIHPDTYQVQAVAFTRARTEWTVLDGAVKDDFQAIGKLDRGDFSVYDRDNADATWLVGFTKDDGPVSFYAYEPRTKKGTFLFDHRPELKRYALARMEPISYQARDGLTIHGYITFPAWGRPKDLPLVLAVHGGPWARDTWGFDSEAQWFANRGYVCLQVNFRGSTGYGKDFVNAGDREWGAKMHDDLIDAVHWAIRRGYADPNKVAIFGGSYGGYAALVGATFTPDVFRCAVSIVGPSNLITLIRSIPPYWTPLLATFYKRVGNPDTEEEFLKSRSPLFKVERIKIPILIGQGANDPRVKQAESEQIVEAMKERGIPYEYVLFPDEGHGFAKPENRLKFYAVAERFLAKHLGGRYEPPPPGADN